MTAYYNSHPRLSSHSRPYLPIQVADRSFLDGDDSRWAALQLAPSTNEQVNFYNETLARTRNGMLELLSNSVDVILPTYGSSTQETRHYQTAMIQVDSVCVTVGAVESVPPHLHHLTPPRPTQHHPTPSSIMQPYPAPLSVMEQVLLL